MERRRRLLLLELLMKLVGWWDGGRSWLLIMDVEVFDFGRGDDECISILLALNPNLPQRDILAWDNLFDFASETDAVL